MGGFTVVQSSANGSATSITASASWKQIPQCFKNGIIPVLGEKEMTLL